MVQIITSFHNSHVKNVLLLEEKPRARKEQNRFIIEGVREVELALQSGFVIHSLFYCPEILTSDRLGNLVKVAPTGTALFEVTTAVYNRMAYRKDHGGIIAIAEPKRLTFEDLSLDTEPLLLVLETVEKPGNLGALLRTADAAAIDAVIICDPQTDIYNPNAIRSGIGCIFTMPVITTSSEQTIQWLHEKRITTFGTALSTDNLYHLSDFRHASALIMGSEAKGLSAIWLEGADHLIKIPMMGKIDSMNVSASAAIVIYEALRQRNFYKPGPSVT
ncbi:MAG: RNA methyltransferase [Bacteroidota bacterium]